ncbi:flagellar biosynthetic protein FliR [Pseudochelatococcus contaminans]|uniref:Flagellar biosynthetic protein FliR n=1 Tax=Pseudochelatococcus contaminans TaxID=1538103 RepID=A0A7W5Z159_9HYPH|nr:flagellar biosynthetic protein FliR [Pseudochelatococcus contaminans]MBB3808005.1 flagellar biosynthetic protein FliR [Pseudochelatococcus contaminans]
MIPVLASDAVIGAMLLMCRVGGCFMLMPGLSNASIPVNIRLYAAIAVTLTMYPLLFDTVAPAFRGQSFSFLLLLVISEVLSGIWIGFLGRLMFLALETLAVLIAMALNLSNPSGVSFDQMEALPPVGAIISLSAAMLVFAADLHWEILRAVKASYANMPPGLLFQSRLSLVGIADQLSSSFLVALRISSPIIIYSVIINFAIGLMNKFTPQIQVYFISIPFVIAGGIILFYFLVQEMLGEFIRQFSRWLIYG